MSHCSSKEPLYGARYDVLQEVLWSDVTAVTDPGEGR